MKARRLDGRRVAFLVANDGIEQIELTTPWNAVADAGGQPVLIAPQAGHAQAFRHLDRAESFPVDMTTFDARASDFDAIVLPGGVANPDMLRLDRAALDFLREADEGQLTIAAICHASWTLIEANIVTGRSLATWPSLATDVKNAGGTWQPHRTHVDRNFISAQSDRDAEAFTTLLIDTLAV